MCFHLFKTSLQRNGGQLLAKYADCLIEFQISKCNAAKYCRKHRRGTMHCPTEGHSLPAWRHTLSTRQVHITLTDSVSRRCTVQRETIALVMLISHAGSRYVQVSTMSAGEAASDRLPLSSKWRSIFGEFLDRTFGGRTTGVGGSPRPSQPQIQPTHQRRQDQGRSCTSRRTTA